MACAPHWKYSDVVVVCCRLLKSCTALDTCIDLGCFGIYHILSMTMCRISCASMINLILLKENIRTIINCAVYIFEKKKIRYETFFPFLKRPKEFVPWNNQITFTFTTISDKFNSVASFRLVFYPGYFDTWYTSSNLHVCTTVSIPAFTLEIFSLPEICLTKRIKKRIRKISSDTVNAHLIKDCKNLARFFWNKNVVIEWDKKRL